MRDGRAGRCRPARAIRRRADGPPVSRCGAGAPRWPRRSGRRRCTPGSAPTSDPGRPCRSCCRGTATSHRRAGRSARYPATAPSRERRRTREAGPPPPSPPSTCPNRIRRRSRPLRRRRRESRCRAPLSAAALGGEADGQIGDVEEPTHRRPPRTRRWRDRARRAGRRRSGWRTPGSAPGHRRGTGRPTGRWSPTGCRRRSACPARRPGAGCRIRGSSDRFRRGSPPRRSARCR